MSSPLYRTFILLTLSCLLILSVASLQIFLKPGMVLLASVTMWFVLLPCMVFFYLIHSGEGKEFSRAFPFVSCVLLTLTGLKLIEARDCLSVLVHTFSVRIKDTWRLSLVIRLVLGIKPGFLFKSTREADTLT